MEVEEIRLKNKRLASYEKILINLEKIMFQFIGYKDEELSQEEIDAIDEYNTLAHAANNIIQELKKIGKSEKGKYQIVPESTRVYEFFIKQVDNKQEQEERRRLVQSLNSLRKSAFPRFKISDLFKFS